MANGYIGDGNVRPLEQAMRTMCQRKGYDLDMVFKGLLDYLLWMLDPDGNTLDGWCYDTEDAKAFFDMACIYFNLMKEMLQKIEWYDAFGDLFMALHPSGGGRGQFFTPPSLCNIMSEISLKEEPQATQRTTFGKRVVISDCACGSSRNLLAAMSVFQQKGWRKPYLVAEDIDSTCCKMSAVNFAVHGCFGEAICHDSLTEPDKVRLGYIVNESMWPFPTNVPSIRRSTAPDQFFCTAHWLQREAVQKAEKKQNEQQQLSLF